VGRSVYHQVWPMADVTPLGCFEEHTSVHHEPLLDHPPFSRGLTERNLSGHFSQGSMTEKTENAFRSSIQPACV
jgi:hypothetical protein